MEGVFLSNDENDIASLIKKSTGIFKFAGIKTARIDSELLLCRALRVDKAYLYTHPEEIPDDGKIEEFSKLVNLRKARMPVQYLIGKQEFWSRDFIVNEGVFIPRPETEMVIEIIIADFEKVMEKTKSRKEDARVIDIGTGTGIIPVTLKNEMLFINMFAVDISHQAIKTAKFNARIHLGGSSVSFIMSDGFSAFSEKRNNAHKPFHIVVSNPPYIPDVDIEKLEPEVSKWEPRTALSGGADGTDMIRYIIEESPRYIRKGGMLIMETGEGQREIIKSIADSTGKYDEVNFYNDYSSKERVAQLWIK